MFEVLRLLILDIVEVKQSWILIDWMGEAYVQREIGEGDVEELNHIMSKKLALVHRWDKMAYVL